MVCSRPLCLCIPIPKKYLQAMDVTSFPLQALPLICFPSGVAAIIWLAAGMYTSSVITQRVTQTWFTSKIMCPTIVTSEKGFLGRYRIQEVCRNVWLTVFLELRISESSSLGDISAQRKMEFPCWVQTKDQTAMLGDCVQILICVSEFLNCTVTSVPVNTDTDFKLLCVA